MTSILDSFIPKFLVNLNRNNEDVITVTTTNFSPEGDQYVVDKRIIAPSVIQTTQSLQELQPELSDMYPYKIVTPLDYDGSTVIISPNITTHPTASQGYYVPVYFERYSQEVLRNINKSFTELATVQKSLVFGE